MLALLRGSLVWPENAMRLAADLAVVGEQGSEFWQSGVLDPGQSAPETVKENCRIMLIGLLVGADSSSWKSHCSLFLCDFSGGEHLLKPSSASAPGHLQALLVQLRGQSGG